MKKPANGKFNAPALSHMRKTIEPTIELNRTLRKNAESRDDDARIEAAAEKRARKAAKHQTSTST